MASWLSGISGEPRPRLCVVSFLSGISGELFRIPSSRAAAPPPLPPLSNVSEVQALVLLRLRPPFRFLSVLKSRALLFVTALGLPGFNIWAWKGRCRAFRYSTRYSCGLCFRSADVLCSSRWVFRSICREEDAEYQREEWILWGWLGLGERLSIAFGIVSLKLEWRRSNWSHFFSSTWRWCFFFPCCERLSSRLLVRFENKQSC